MDGKSHAWAVEAVRTCVRGDAHVNTERHRVRDTRGTHTSMRERAVMYTVKCTHMYTSV